MPAIGRNTKGARLDQLSDAAIQARWAALLPKFIKGAIIAAVLAGGLFLYNHFAHPPQQLTDYLQAAFQIVCIFAVCFVFLTGAAFYFRSDAWINKPR